MAITGIAALTGSSNSSSASASSSTTAAFSGDDFMRLLLTQLKYQDPLNPMKDQEFMTQLTQMNTLSEMQKLNSNVETLQKTQAMTQGASLIGKFVQAKSGDNVVTAQVQSVAMQGSDLMLDIGQGVPVPLSAVQGIWSI